MHREQLPVDALERLDNVRLATGGGDRPCRTLGPLSRLREEQQRLVDLLVLEPDHGAECTTRSGWFLCRLCDDLLLGRGLRLV